MLKQFMSIDIQNAILMRNALDGMLSKRPLTDEEIIFESTQDGFIATIQKENANFHLHYAFDKDQVSVKYSLVHKWNDKFNIKETSFQLKYDQRSQEVDDFDVKRNFDVVNGIFAFPITLLSVLRGASDLREILLDHYKIYRDASSEHSIDVEKHTAERRVDLLDTLTQVTNQEREFGAGQRVGESISYQVDNVVYVYQVNVLDDAITFHHQCKDMSLNCTYILMTRAVPLIQKKDCFQFAKAVMKQLERNKKEFNVQIHRLQSIYTEAFLKDELDVMFNSVECQEVIDNTLSNSFKI